MEQHRTCLQVRTCQVRKQLLQIRGQHHALVAQQARRQRRDVELGVLAQTLLAVFARQKQRAFECLRVGAIACYKHLFDARTRGPGEGATHCGIHRHCAPTGHLHATSHKRGFQRFAALRSSHGCLRQKHIARRKLRALQGDAGLFGQCAHEILRAVQQHPAAIARQAIGGHTTTMRHP